MIVSYRTLLLLVVLPATLLGSCAETAFLAHATKEIQNHVGIRKESETYAYKIGNPYQINDVWYYPKVDYSYAETGIASWYGPKFHKRKTANGEIFDMNKLTAAHRTLPLPSIVRVTNLNSGRALNVRVNDRGPFARGRIIDMSRQAAQLLGFEKAGTAPVRVEILAEESRLLATKVMHRAGISALAIEPKTPEAAPTVSVTSASLAPPEGVKSLAPISQKFLVAPKKNTTGKSGHFKPNLAEVDGKISIEPVIRQAKIFIQIGAYTKFQNARKVRAILKQLGTVKITQIDKDRQPYFRVRIGPLSEVTAADQILAQVVQAGYKKATTVVE